MGMELFGYESGIYLGIACLIAYFFSGKSSIYASQNLEGKFYTDISSWLKKKST
jgi:H+/Cl- antiporter ClcA